MAALGDHGCSGATHGARPDPFPSQDKALLNAQGGMPIGPKAGNASK